MIGRAAKASGWQLALVVAAVVVPGALPAQSGAQRSAVFRWRDSLGQLRDTTTLLALESRGIDSARSHRDDASLHLRLGFIGLRIGELTGGASHFRDAESEFEWTTELQPQWPMGWYALGTAELAEADAYPPGLRALFHALGRDVFRPAAHDLAHSARVDSMFIRGVVDLGNDALRSGIGAHLTAALEALREVNGTPASHNPDVLLVRARVEREVGDVDSAVVIFRALIDRDPSDATANLELARTTLAAGRISGVQPWYRGLAIADSSTLALYRSDLALVMSDSALQAFDAAKGEGHVAVARKFWDSRDPEGLNGSADRLREHYRRIAFAHRRYPLLPPGHPYDSLISFEATGSRFDDRGRIYVRHGEPDARTALSMAGIPPNESWIYHRPHGDLLFNFAQPDTAQGFRMYESLFDILALGAAARATGQADVRARLDSGTPVVTYGAAWTAQAAEELLYSREKLSPVYGKILASGRQGATALQQSERAAGRESIRVGLQTDSWSLHYELPLTANIDVVAVGSDSAGTELQVVFAIPGTSLYARPSPGLVVYPIRMRVAVRNAAGQVVVAVDTLRNFVAEHQVPLDGRLLGRLPVHVPPGAYTVRVALETPGRGLVTQPEMVQVAALHASAVEISDLALGARSVPLPWLIGAADTAWVSPLHSFKGGEPMQVFFDVGGVTPGASYRVQLAVMRAGRSDAQMQIGFTAVATGTPDLFHREIDLGRLAAGTYVLQVTVSTPDGDRAVRQRSFVVTR